MPGRRRIEYVPLDEVVAAAVNPKRHDDAGIDASMGRFGVIDVVSRDDRTGRLVSGHGRVDSWHRTRAAGGDPPDGVDVADDGTWLVPLVVGWSSVDDDDAEAAGVALNHLTERGGWDGQSLVAVLNRLHAGERGLTGTGYSPTDLGDLVAAYGKPPDLGDLPGRLERRPEDSWPTLRIRLPQPLMDRWVAATKDVDGDDVARLTALLDRAEQAAATA